MSNRNNIYIDQSADFKFRIDGLIDTTANLDIVSTYDFFSDIRKVYSSTSITEFQITRSNTEISLNLSGADSANLKPGKYQYDVLMRNDIGQITKVVDGIMFLIPSMTKIPVPDVSNTDVSNTDVSNTDVSNTDVSNTL